MSVLFSKTCEYGVLACIYLARHQRDQLLMQKDIAKEIKVPLHFLGKILQALSRYGIINSIKGKNGGFQLSRHPRQISIIEIIHAIEGPMFMEGCFLGLPGCSDKKPCAAHTQWKPIKNRLLKLLDKKLITFCPGFTEKL